MALPVLENVWEAGCQICAGLLTALGNGSSITNPIAFENLNQIGGRLDILQLWNWICAFCRRSAIDLESVVEGMHSWMADIKSWQKPLLSCTTISIIFLLRSAMAFPLSVHVKLLSSSKSWAIAARTIPIAISYYNRCSATLHWQPLMTSFTWRKWNEPISRNF